MRGIVKTLILVLCITSSVFSVVNSVEPWSGVTNPPQTKNKYFLHTGFIFDAVLQTAIFSYNLESPVIAETEYDIIYQNKTVIPKGTKLIGYAGVLKSGDRVNIFFHTVVFPNGQEIIIQGLALHTDGSAGIPGKVEKQRAAIPAKILFETAANIAAPGIGGAVVKGLSSDAAKEIRQYKPEYSITINKSTAIQIYNTGRIEY